ncbi:MAG: tRNA (guanosine(46)-N7)-methyltransferase TrmB [Bifidobacterium sp.]|nr:tRNA (guanosine(46)-N7)-methyltransferase TrmB [Bifidobacterium sp.]
MTDEEKNEEGTAVPSTGADVAIDDGTADTAEVADAAADVVDEAVDAAPGRPPLYGRKVLSFVRRSARLDARLQRAWDAYADALLLDDITAPGELDPRDGFRLDRAYVRRHWGNDHPLVVEIGTGQGENIAAAAAARPDTNFLAVEVYDPGVAHTMLLAGKQGLDNLRIAQVNAPELIKDTETGLVEEVWTFFPDPWPKTRHHKRRIVQPALAGDVRRALADGGAWRIATDIDDYALHVHEVMDGRDDFENVGTITVSLPTEHVGKGNADQAADLPHENVTESVRYAGRVFTNFERKGMDAGRVIHDFTYRKR